MPYKIRMAIMFTQKWKRRTRLQDGKMRPEYQSWMAMKHRCMNPKRQSYERYGGRGISVCREWLNSFDAFLEDMGERPANTSLDRIDNNSGYNKLNCRWASKEVQARQARRYSPDEPCKNCGSVSHPLRKGLCHRCNEFLRRNGYDWTAERAKPHPRVGDRPCKICGRTVKRGGGYSKGRCPTCRLYITAHGVERSVFLPCRA
jgi:hypothetical protein